MAQPIILEDDPDDIRERPVPRQGLCRLPRREDCVPILAPTVAVPDKQFVLDHFRRFILSRLSETSDTFEATRRAKRRAEHWYARRLTQSGLGSLKSETWPPLINLARHQAKLLGPRTMHEVDELFAGLHAEAPWFQKVSAFLLAHTRADILAGRIGLRPPPILLVGPPGNGKLAYGRRLAELAGLPFQQIDVGSGTSGFRISGLEKGWGTATPSLPVTTILDKAVANPALLVAEIDKSGTLYSDSGRTSSSIATSLLQLLEPSSASVFDCPFYRLRFDLSHVVWILTANSASTVPPAILDRCRIFHVPSPGFEDLRGIYDRLSADIEDENATEAGHHALEKACQRAGGASLRGLHRLLDIVRAQSILPKLH